MIFKAGVIPCPVFPAKAPGVWRLGTGRAWACLILLLAVAACAPAQQQGMQQAVAEPKAAAATAATTAGAPPKEVEQPEPTEKEPVAQPPEQPELAESAEQAPNKPAASAPPPQPEKSIDLALLPGTGSLLGLDHGQVNDMLGPPDFRRRDDPAEIWQYRRQTCVLDVFLYREKTGGLLTVAHVEVRRPDSAQQDSGKFAGRKCLYGLKKDREKQTTG